MSACHSCAAAARLLGSTLPSARRGNRRPLPLPRPGLTLLPSATGPSGPGPSLGPSASPPRRLSEAKPRSPWLSDGCQRSASFQPASAGLSRERGPAGHRRSGVSGGQPRSRRPGDESSLGAWVVPCCSAAIRASVRQRAAGSAFFFPFFFPCINLLCHRGGVRGRRWRVRIKGNITCSGNNLFWNSFWEM